MHLAALGINFRNTPVELRETLSFSSDAVPAVLDQMRERSPSTELLLLSTCNRTELYAAGPETETTPEKLAELLLGDIVAHTCRKLQPYLYHREQKEALAHLMSVASSLDSMVVGETEILGQVKQAFEAAQVAESVGSYLTQVMQRTFKVAKRVRSETEISRGRVSVGSVAVELAGKVFADLSSKTVMVVGAGEVNDQTLKHLVAKGVREALVLNRSMDRGRALADRYGGTAVAMDRLEEYLPRADIVVSSTSAPHFVIHRETVHRAVLQRHHRPMFLIDLAVPRDIDPAVGDLNNAYLYDIDDLQKLTDENLARRQAAVARAREIIDEEVVDASVVFRAENLGEVMRKIDAKASSIVDDEFKRAFSKSSVAPIPGTCDRCREEIRNMLRRSMSKMTAESKKALNEAAKGERWDEFAEMVERLMGIDDKNG